MTALAPRGVAMMVVTLNFETSTGVVSTGGRLTGGASTTEGAVCVAAAVACHRGNRRVGAGATAHSHRQAAIASSVDSGDAARSATGSIDGLENTDHPARSPRTSVCHLMTGASGTATTAATGSGDLSLGGHGGGRRRRRRRLLGGRPRRGRLLLDRRRHHLLRHGRLGPELVGDRPSTEKEDDRKDHELPRPAAGRLGRGRRGGGRGRSSD